MKVRKFFISVIITAALSAGLCGCASNSGASFFRGTDGTGTGNTGFYGDYTYGARNAYRKETTKRDSKNITDTIDNSDSAKKSARKTRGLGNSGEAYFYDSDGNIIRKDATGGMVGSDNFKTSTSEGFSFPKAPVVP